MRRRWRTPTIYLQAAGHVVVAWLWLEQLLALGDDADAFARGKRAAARVFHRSEPPKVDAHLDLLERMDRTVVDVEEARL